MQIKSQKTFFSGIMFTCVGAAFAIGATNYNVGSAARMGPGYFPLIIGTLLGVLGLVVVSSAFTVKTADGEPVGKIAWKPLGFIIGANLLFGILLAGLHSIGLPAMGLIDRDLRARGRGLHGGRELLDEALADPRDGARHRQLPHLHRGTEAAVPGVAHLHQRLSRGAPHA
jgi:hypothetical protein